MTSGIENPYHISLKKIAEYVLTKQGYEVKFEFIVPKKPIGRRKRYEVDVAGFKKGKKVAIECGKVSKEKIRFLEEVFNEVIILDLNNVFGFLSEEVLEGDKLEKFKFFVIEILKENDLLKKKLELLTNPENGERKKELLQIRCTKKTLNRFRKFLSEGIYRNSNEALNDLLDMSERREFEFNRALRQTEKYDISVVSVEDHQKRDISVTKF